MVTAQSLDTKIRNRAVFLDRDGVINRAIVKGGKPYAPRELKEFRLLPGATAAVQDLKCSGFVIFVVTNQPDIGHGLIDPQALERMHERLRERLPIDDIRVCPHRQDEGCMCRKPRPGMLNSLAEEWNIDMAGSYMIGDRESDINAGKNAGCKTILIDRNYAEGCSVKPNFRVRSIRDSIELIQF